MAASLLRVGICPLTKSCFSGLKLANPVKIIVATYAKPTKAKGKTKGMAYQPVEKKELEVETDPEKLVNYCCGANYFKAGEDPKIKPDEEYPDWLWELRTERRPIPLEELDQDDPYYWRRLRKMHFRRATQLMKKK
ncbi:large ribosomal subunit protein mL54-like [Lineus longissimus]|uniref:large ribosomal subunit protein mL54-like n=1 Tax=Lineus longissimus TaxID=88925 RepID=UPI002B4E84D7